jgi:hypothetical protein
MKKKIFLSEKNKAYLDNLDFKRVSELISFQQIYDSIHKRSRFTLSIIGGSVIILEILIAASFSGWVFKEPIFSIIEWLIMLATLFCLLKINFGVKSKQYLTIFFPDVQLSYQFVLLSYHYQLGLYFFHFQVK